MMAAPQDVKVAIETLDDGIKLLNIPCRRFQYIGAGSNSPRFAHCNGVSKGN
jgi:hypothetical protein